jgi:hypothetical protein
MLGSLSIMLGSDSDSIDGRTLADPVPLIGIEATTLLDVEMLMLLDGKADILLVGVAPALWDGKADTLLVGVAPELLDGKFDTLLVGVASELMDGKADALLDDAANALTATLLTGITKALEDAIGDLTAIIELMMDTTRV